MKSFCLPASKYPSHLIWIFCPRFHLSLWAGKVCSYLQGLSAHLVGGGHQGLLAGQLKKAGCNFPKSPSISETQQVVFILTNTYHVVLELFLYFP